MNIASRGWPQGHSTQGFPSTTNAAIPGFQGWPRPRLLSDGTLAGDILKDAVFYIDAAEHQASGANAKTIRNLGWGGDVLNARSGSTTVADTNDPLFLPYYGTSYVYCAATAFPGISSPASSALNITGDIDLRVHVALAGYTSSQTIFSRTTSAAQQSYALGFNAGKLKISWSVDGIAANIKSASSTVNVPAVAGDDIWLRATLSVASNYQAMFYTSTDGVSWTQLGASVNGSGATSIFAGTDSICIGGGDYFTTSPAGNYYRVQVYNGINGILVFDADTSVLTGGSQTTFTEKSANAATVTINRATSGRKSVAVVAPVWLFGADDQFVVGKHTLLDFDQRMSFTVVTATRHWPSNANQWIIGNSYYAPGWYVAYSSVGGIQGNLRGSTNSGGNPQNAPLVFQFQRSVENRTITEAGLVTKDRTPDGVNSLLRTQIGHDASGAYAYADMEFMAAAIFRRTLSNSEMATLTAYFQQKWA